MIQGLHNRSSHHPSCRIACSRDPRLTKWNSLLPRDFLLQNTLHKGSWTLLSNSHCSGKARTSHRTPCGNADAAAVYRSVSSCIYYSYRQKT